MIDKFDNKVDKLSTVKVSRSHKVQICNDSKL